ncbi:ABC transporter ATP-binding protein [Acrocarpospora pleiomorpha]|uniref:ABC transporter ATP-binding protein n=1 Tax=Acrocarpospora pleiomorpha TaxID=90975 RepID=A0A5M3XLS5_9ACTN|nr:ABC transporter ATP-binding protein [Acrocarpospora pleiomorpha]GES19108.1 ABC transporter ATP-binding protein [Acrocarpospora pleiomorpha]
MSVSVTAAPVVRARALVKTFPVRRNLVGRTVERLHAVDGVDLTAYPGQTLGIVGESGSGKSTVGRLVARLLTPDSGTVEIGGRELTDIRGRRLRQARADMQMIFQNPYSALDPTKTIGHAVAEPLLAHGRCLRREMYGRAAELLERVALDPALVTRYPSQLSGGQRQRVCIARALALEPKLLIADEPTSALDLSTRSEILNLLLRLQEDAGQAMILISHDVTTIKHLSHRVAVMYLGRVVEEGAVGDLIGEPRHPYTQALLSAVPEPDPMTPRRGTRIVLTGDPPSPIDLPSGCRFRTRCPIATPECAITDPPLVPVGAEHVVACVHRA